MIPEWIPLIPCHSGIDTGTFHNPWNFAKPELLYRMGLIESSTVWLSILRVPSYALSRVCEKVIFNEARKSR
jgi:hypothetical protein